MNDKSVIPTPDLARKLIAEQFPSYEIRYLGEEEFNKIQVFLNLFDDFFMLCEGEKGTAASLLSACPPGKDVTIDKILMGIYSEDVLMSIIDLIKDYPEEGVWTVGYLLIHPDYRNQKIGSYIIGEMSRSSDIKKLRCVVQAQNPRALKFWQNLGFITTDSIKEHLGDSESDIFILEKECEYDEKILDELTSREPIFHHPEMFGKTKEDIDNQMCDEFWEVGASGAIYTKQDVIEALLERYNNPDYQDIWEAKDFKLTKIAPDNYLLTYVLIQNTTRVTRRSTVWRKVGGDWKILYHQGTVINGGTI